MTTAEARAILAARFGGEWGWIADPKGRTWRATPRFWDDFADHWAGLAEDDPLYRGDYLRLADAARALADEAATRP
jgi:hypothetical protein